MVPGFRLLCLFVSLYFGFCAPPPPHSTSMKVVNHAGAPIELYWINTFERIPGKSRNLVLQTTKPLRNNTDSMINSYDTHQFVVKFKKIHPHLEVSFTKGPRDEVVTIGFTEEQGLTVRQTTKFDDILDTIKSASKDCTSENEEEYANCVANAIMDDITRMTDSKELLQKSRDNMSSRLRNYTCADPALNTTKPVSSYQYNSPDGQKSWVVNTLFDTSHAKIWSVDDFLTDDECNILINHGRPRLQRATVAAEDGTSTVSENRKAQQASYNIQSSQTSDPLWPLYSRILDLTNRHTGYRLEYPGQEDFTIIQYDVSDEYTPHCDGTCDGSPHTPRGRVATAVLYCKVAELGGATTFTKADVFVQPKNNSATFFSYRGLDGRMDEGYTEHSGCPVLQGEKWITTVWMRDGVTKDEPSTLYDPSGNEILYSDGEQETQGSDQHDEL